MPEIFTAIFDTITSRNKLQCSFNKEWYGWCRFWKLKIRFYYIKMIILATVPVPVIDPLSVVASFVIGATTAGTTIYYVSKNIKKEKKD